MTSRIAKSYNEITVFSDMYNEEINQKINELDKSSNFYEIFHGCRRIIYNLHKQETIKLYMKNMTRDEATREYSTNFITEEEYIFYKEYSDE